MPGKYVLDHIMPAGRLSGIEEKVQMTTTATLPQAIQVSVLRWTPPIVHGLVRDLRVRWALVEADPESSATMMGCRRYLPKARPRPVSTH